MIKRQNDLQVTVNEKMRGGEGSVIIKHLLDKEGLYEKGRLYGHFVLKQGCSTGYHVHEGEMETFYVIKGKAVYNDNGTEMELNVGDVAYTPDGSGHAIANHSAEDLELIALVISSK